MRARPGHETGRWCGWAMVGPFEEAGAEYARQAFAILVHFLSNRPKFGGKYRDNVIAPHMTQAHIPEVQCLSRDRRRG